MKGLLIVGFFIFSIQGCAEFQMGSGGPRPGQIVMGERDEIEVGHISNETEGGQPITEFYCGGMLICNVYGTRKFCTCQYGDIYLPSRMRL